MEAGGETEPSVKAEPSGGSETEGRAPSREEAEEDHVAPAGNSPQRWGTPDAESAPENSSLVEHDGERNRIDETDIPRKRMRIRHPLRLPDDGHLWQQYGQKRIKGTDFMRKYYRCGLFKILGCPAKRTVDFHKDNLRRTVVSHLAKHNHPLVPDRSHPHSLTVSHEAAPPSLPPEMKLEPPSEAEHGDRQVYYNPNGSQKRKISQGEAAASLEEYSQKPLKPVALESCLTNGALLEALLLNIGLTKLPAKAERDTSASPSLEGSERSEREGGGGGGEGATTGWLSVRGERRPGGSGEVVCGPPEDDVGLQLRGHVAVVREEARGGEGAEGGRGRGRWQGLDAGWLGLAPAAGPEGSSGCGAEGNGPYIEESRPPAGWERQEERGHEDLRRPSEDYRAAEGDLETTRKESLSPKSLLGGTDSPTGEEMEGLPEREDAGGSGQSTPGQDDPASEEDIENRQEGDKVVRRRRIHHRLGIPYDGYFWEKYGQKHIKGTRYMRNYYRCAMYKKTECPAKRTIDYHKDSFQRERTAYMAQHNHPILSLHRLREGHVAQQQEPTSALPPTSSPPQLLEGPVEETHLVNSLERAADILIRESSIAEERESRPASSSRDFPKENWQTLDPGWLVLSTSSLPSHSSSGPPSNMEPPPRCTPFSLSEEARCESSCSRGVVEREREREMGEPGWRRHRSWDGSCSSRLEA